MKKNSPALFQISASAGSGKTYFLTSRYLEILASGARTMQKRPWACNIASPSGSLGEILAITFTNAAAAEMRARVIGRLKDVALGLRQDDMLTRGQALDWLDAILLDMGSLNIRTIDSLLHLIVHSSTLELGLNPDFSLAFSTDEALESYTERFLEDALEDETLGKLTREAIRASIEYGSAKGFLGAGNFRKHLSQVLEDAILGRFDGISSFDAIKGRLFQLRSDAQAAAANFYRLTALFSGKLKIHAAAALEAYAAGNFAHKSEYFNKPLARDLFKGKPDIPDSIEEGYQIYAARMRTLFAEKGILRQGVQMSAFVDVARRVADYFHNDNAPDKMVPAALIPHYAASILREGAGVPDALCRIGTRLTHFLIDEFQDTSQKQWRVLRFLAQEAISRGGTLTWAGDVKQSIYGWRGGDAALFHGVLKDRELLSICPLPRQESLDLNWRSARTIVEHNNSIFSSLGNKEMAGGILATFLPRDFPDRILDEAAARLADTFASRGQKCVAEYPFSGYVHCLEVTGANTSELNETILENTRSLILEQVAGRRQWSDVLILCRSNSNCNDVAIILLEAGIPVITENSLLLASHPLIVQTVAFLKFMFNPDDDVSFLTILSGPIFGESAFAPEEMDPLDWAASRKGNSSLQQAFRNDFQNIWDKIFAPFFRDASLRTPYDLVMGWYSLLEVESRFSEARAFLRRFLEIVFLVEEKSGKSLAAFLEFWAGSGAEERAPVPETMNAVRVMTIHKAKGLEAPVVIVPWTNFRLSPASKSVVMERHGLKIPLKLVRDAGEAYYHEQARQAIEAINLLYVALTRAREELYFFLPRNTGRAAETACATALQKLINEAGLQCQYPLGERPCSASLPPVASREEAILENSLRGSSGPRDWLPRLKVFRAHPASPVMTPNERGLFLHLCLERLRFTGKPSDDADAAFQYGLANSPFNVPADPHFRKKLRGAIFWFASIPRAAEWLKTGWPEQSMIMPGRKEIARCDLLVPSGDNALIIDYKSGDPEPANIIQLRGYLECVRQSGQFPGEVKGLLIYLDLHRFQIVTPGGATELLDDFSKLP